MPPPTKTTILLPILTLITLSPTAKHTAHAAPWARHVSGPWPHFAQTTDAPSTHSYVAFLGTSEPHVFEVLQQTTVELLAIGGGAAGSIQGGGGGAGRLFHTTAATLPGGNYTITIGAGGVATSQVEHECSAAVFPTPISNNGQPTTIHTPANNTLTAIGGGGSPQGGCAYNRRCFSNTGGICREPKNREQTAASGGSGGGGSPMCTGDVASQNWDTVGPGGSVDPVAESDCGALHPIGSCDTYMFGNPGADCTCDRSSTWTARIGGGGGGAGTPPLDTNTQGSTAINAPFAPYLYRGGDGKQIPITGDPFYWGAGGGGIIHLKWDTYAKLKHVAFGGKGGAGTGSSLYHSPIVNQNHRGTYVTDDVYWGHENHEDDVYHRRLVEHDDAIVELDGHPIYGYKGGSAAPNTGSGGGASSISTAYGGEGGSGIVIMRYSTTNPAANSIEFTETCPSPYHVCKPGTTPYACQTGEYFLNNTCQTCNATHASNCSQGFLFNNGCYDDVPGLCIADCSPQAGEYCAGETRKNTCTHTHINHKNTKPEN